MRVADVMSAPAIAVSPETPLKEVVELMASAGFSGVPVVDSQQHVLGVVSEADILVKQRGPLARIRGKEARRSHAKRGARTAAEAMSWPAVTIAATARMDLAAAMMLDCDVNRLPVVDSDDVLVGIVTRADLVRAFVHSDDEIAAEIRQGVLVGELWRDPDLFVVRVKRGEVTIDGPVSGDELMLLVRRISLVPGVVSVDARPTHALVGAG
ncbi:MAG TPA: CBS domain-containing protein [Gaiellaceae bacterium]|nr:CBS domain-containing protein [Gaiellaceae bacterium]